MTAEVAIMVGAAIGATTGTMKLWGKSGIWQQYADGVAMEPDQAMLLGRQLL